jgi:hypothetical protein
VIVNGPIILATVGWDLAASTAMSCDRTGDWKATRNRWEFFRLRRQLQRGTREYEDTQNVRAATINEPTEQPSMPVGPGTNRLRTSKPCGAPIEAALTMFRDLTEQLWVNGW